MSSVVLIVLSPLLLASAILLSIESSGGPVFRHTRVGRDRRLFSCYKLRTMRSDIKLSDEAKARHERNYKLENDPRVTKVGYFLRKSSIDEVPQLWNVIKGDMALVGPRPVTEDEIDLMFGEKSAVVLSVRPGITGLWQVSGRSKLEYSERIALDIEYVHRRGLWFDLKILLKTIPAVLRTHQTS